MEQKNKFCVSCGEKLDLNFKFCPSCGEAAAATGAGLKPVHQGGGNKPVSPEASRLVEEFDARLAEMRAARDRKARSPMGVMKKAFDPKYKMIALGGSVVFTGIVLLVMVVLFKYLLPFMQAATNPQ
jgi:hypothetical protein